MTYVIAILTAPVPAWAAAALVFVTIFIAGTLGALMVAMAKAGGRDERTTLEDL